MLESNFSHSAIHHILILNSVEELFYTRLPPQDAIFIWPPSFQYNRRLLRRKTGGACLYMPQDGHWLASSEVAPYPSPRQSWLVCTRRACCFCQRMSHFCCFRWASSSGLARRRFPSLASCSNLLDVAHSHCSLLASAACVYETGLPRRACLFCLRMSRCCSFGWAPSSGLARLAFPWCFHVQSCSTWVIVRYYLLHQLLCSGFIGANSNYTYSNSMNSIRRAASSGCCSVAYAAEPGATPAVPPWQ